MRRIATFLLFTIVLTIVLGQALAEPFVWTVPPDQSGYLVNDPNNPRMSGTIKVAKSSNNSLGRFDCETAYDDGLVTLAGGTFPVVTYYYQNAYDPAGEPETCNWSRLAVQFTTGEHSMELVGRSREYPAKYSGATWHLVVVNPGCGFPLFCLPRHSQVGNRHPYAGGSTTMAQNGCCLMSVESIIEYLTGARWTPEEFNTFLLEGDAFSGNDIYVPTVADLTGVVEYGRERFNMARYSEKLGQGYLGLLGVSSHRRNGTWGSHYLASSPGMKTPAIFPFMDPADRYESFGAAPNYRFQTVRWFSTKCHRMLMTNGWWKNPFRYLACNAVGPIGGGGASATTTEGRTASRGRQAAAGGSELTEEAKLLLSKVAFLTGDGAFIEYIEAPGFGLVKDDITVLGRTLIDIPSEWEDDTLESSVPDTSEPDPPATHSEATICGAPSGEYRVHLTGTANAVWKMHCYRRDTLGNSSHYQLEGTLGSVGKAVATIPHEPGAIVTRLGELRQLALGRRILFRDIQVTDVGENEFFCESADRVCGVRVTVPEGGQMPERGQMAMVDGVLSALSPEITILATMVSPSERMYGEPLQPLGIPGEWPEMANCLLAKIWGKVISHDGDAVITDNGSGPITVRGIDIFVSVGDYITFEAVLRASREVNAIGDTASIVE